MAGQRLGQNFLADSGWRARIVAALGAKPADEWLEIGAGHGELTRLLAAKSQRVVAVELDRKLVESLRRLARERTNIEVVAGDILELDLAQIAGAGPVRVYGSLPYYITSPILHRLFEHAERIASAHIVVQLEVAARLAARPERREFGYLSVATQFFTRPEIVFKIPPGAFRPRPKVASALVALRFPGARAGLNVADEQAFLRFVQGCFAQKRKTLANNLRANWDDAEIRPALDAAGVAANARAEELRVAQFASLFQELR